MPTVVLLMHIGVWMSKTGRHEVLVFQGRQKGAFAYISYLMLLY